MQVTRTYNFKHITEFLESHNILSNYQHGFRRGYSTTTQLIEFTHDICQSLDLGGQIDGIFVDLSKAFDTVPHPKLLYKLNSILNNPSLVGWIHSFLTQRSQSVHFNGSISSPVSVSSGVPQGSVLGPLLFLLYINDLPHCVSVSIRLYADDCVLYHSINTPMDHDLLNDSFAKFCRWCKEWQMNINFSKTVSMSFSRRPSPSLFTYTFHGQDLKRVTEFKYLGLHFSHDMSWSKHIDIICNKAFRRLGYLHRSLRKAPKDTKLMTYKTLIRPILDYGCIIWNPHKKSDIKKLESVQKKSVRFIFRNYSRDFSPSSHYTATGLTVLSSRRRLECMKFLHTLIHSERLVTLNNYLNFSPPSITRSSHNLNLIPFFCRTEMFKHSFFPLAIELWNSLPGSIRSLPMQEFLKAITYT